MKYMGKTIKDRYELEEEDLPLHRNRQAEALRFRKHMIHQDRRNQRRNAEKLTQDLEDRE